VQLRKGKAYFQIVPAAYYAGPIECSPLLESIVEPSDNAEESKRRRPSSLPDLESHSAMGSLEDEEGLDDVEQQSSQQLGE
jgi:hypothetical protein